MKLSEFAAAARATVGVVPWAIGEATKLLGSIIGQEADPVVYRTIVFPGAERKTHDLTLWAATEIGFVVATVRADSFAGEDAERRVDVCPWVSVTDLSLRVTVAGDDQRAATLTVNGNEITCVAPREAEDVIALYRQCEALSRPR